VVQDIRYKTGDYGHAERSRISDRGMVSRAIDGNQWHDVGCGVVVRLPIGGGGVMRWWAGDFVMWCGVVLGLGCLTFLVMIAVGWL
jgi:hypothetical protein